MPAVPTRSFPSTFALELNGSLVGRPLSIEGGEPIGEVVTEPVGVDRVTRKHLGGVDYEDIVVECGAGMADSFYAWIADTLDHTFSRKNGAIVTADMNGKEVTRRTFEGAVVSSVGFPALDAASKDTARLRVALTPDVTRRKPPGGAKPSEKLTASKKWLASAFRLKIDGLDCTKVLRIEPIVVFVRSQQAPVGELRIPTIDARIDVPDLVVTLAESGAATWDAWVDDFLVAGNDAQDREKSGTLELLAQDLTTKLFTLHFSGLGIYRLHRVKQPAGSEAIPRVTASLYCEQLRLTVGAAQPKPATAPAPVVALPGQPLRPVRLDPPPDRPTIRLPQ